MLLFHDAIAAQIEDQRLRQARRSFLAEAPRIKDLRDFLEHLDQYLLGLGNAQKRGEIAARIAPILLLRWDSANVVVEFGDQTLDITRAAEAAVLLAQTTGEVWFEYLQAARGGPSEPPPDDGVRRMLEMTISPSTIIGGEDENCRIMTGPLRGIGTHVARDDE